MKVSFKVLAAIAGMIVLWFALALPVAAFYKLCWWTIFIWKF